MNNKRLGKTGGGVKSPIEAGLAPEEIDKIRYGIKNLGSSFQKIERKENAGENLMSEFADYFHGLRMITPYWDHLSDNQKSEITDQIETIMMMFDIEINEGMTPATEPIVQAAQWFAEIHYERNAEFCPQTPIADKAIVVDYLRATQSGEEFPGVDITGRPIELDQKAASNMLDFQKRMSSAFSRVTGERLDLRTDDNMGYREEVTGSEIFAGLIRFVELAQEESFHDEWINELDALESDFFEEISCDGNSVDENAIKSQLRYYTQIQGPVKNYLRGRDEEVMSLDSSLVYDESKEFLTLLKEHLQKAAAVSGLAFERAMTALEVRLYLK